MMANLPQDFWSGWVIVLVVTSLAGLLWVVIGVYFQKDAGHDPAHEPVWDGNLREGDHPAPMWWFWLILASMVFTVLYLMLYPGLGSFAGALRWSQGGQLAANTQLYEVEFQAMRGSLDSQTMAELAANPVAMEAARRLFMDHCAACHGADARGQANLFPNLRDNEWTWGGETEQIEQTIRNGRNAVMAPWAAALGAVGVNNVADYVIAMSRGTPPEEHPGRQQYMTFCVACHGADGAGNPLLGAPRLNDDIWLYGGNVDSVRATIRNGRNGVMPAFADTLDDLQIKLLMSWLLR